MSNENEVKIQISTIDNTASGIDAVNNHFKDFDETLENLDKKLKPLQSVLDGGIAAGGTVGALGSLAKESGNLGAAFEDLKANFLGIADSAGESVGSLTGFHAAIDNIAKVGAETAKVFGALKTSVEIARKVTGAIEAGRTIWDVYKTSLQNATAATAAANTATAAVNTATVANTVTVSANIAANSANTASVQISAAAAVSRTAAKITENTAIAAGSAATSINTAKTLTNTAATTAAGNASVATAAKITIWSRAQAILNAIMAANPIMIWCTAIAAGVTLLSMYGKSIWNWITGAKKASEETEKNCAALQKQREEHQKASEEMSQYAGRLELLAQKESLTQEESQEAAQMIDAMNQKYKDLNLTLEDAANGFERLKIAQARETIQDANKEIEALEEHLKNLQNESGRGSAEERKENREDIGETLQKIEEAKKRRLDASNTITNLELANQKKVQQEKEKNQDLVKDLQEEISNEGKSQLQRELDAVQKKIDARDQEMQKLLQEGKISEEQYDQEMQQIKNVGEERKKQIEERFKKEADEKAKAEAAEEAKAKAEEAKRNRDEVQGYADSMKQAFQKTSQERREEKEDEDFASLMETNPLKAFQFAREKTAQSVNLEQNAKADWQKMFQEAKKDSVIDEAEKKQLEKAQTRYEEALRQRERSESKLKSAQGAIDQNVQDILGKQGAPSGPVDALMKGSMEAFQKETELRNQEKPAEKNIQNIVDILREHFRISENFAVQNRETSDQIRNGLVGV